MTSDPVITNYRRARKDAYFLVDWARSCPEMSPTAFPRRYLEALAVMSGHDAIILIAVVLLADGKMPRLPDDPTEGEGVPETGA